MVEYIKIRAKSRILADPSECISHALPLTVANAGAILKRMSENYRGECVLATRNAAFCTITVTGLKDDYFDISCEMNKVECVLSASEEYLADVLLLGSHTCRVMKRTLFNENYCYDVVE